MLYNLVEANCVFHCNNVTGSLISKGGIIMACPICDRIYCDHTPEERGQSHAEMMADCYGTTVEEFKKGTNPLATVEKESKKRTKKGKARTKKQK